MPKLPLFRSTTKRSHVFKLSALSLLITSTSLLTTTAYACQGDKHTWFEKSPSQFVFKGKDTCGGSQDLVLEHNGYEIPVSIKEDGSYETLIAMTDGRNSVFLKNSKGEFIPLLDTEVNLIKAAARATNTPLESISQTPVGSERQALKEAFELAQHVKLHDSNDGNWSRLNDAGIDVSAMMAAENKKAAILPPKKFFTVEMTWSEPVDLDLHVFEPTFKSVPAVNEESTGHLWSKASPTLKELAYGKMEEHEQVEPGQTRREVYHLEPIDGKIPEGPYQLKVDYRDRTIRRNLEPMTCKGGVYASPKATLRIRTADFDTTREFSVPAIECGTALVRGKVLATVGTIQLE